MAFILFVGALYLHNRSDIQQVLENTGLVETLSERLRSNNGNEPDPESTPDTETNTDGGQAHQTPTPTRETPQIELIPDERLSQESSPDRDSSARDSADRDSADRDTTGGEDEAAAEDPPSIANRDSSTEPETTPESDPPEASPTRSRDFPLYFIRVTDSGTIYPDRVVREVAFVDAPLTAMLQVLIQGPNSQEIERGLHHLIPKDTRLISASVRGGVAYLNFNEAFQFNPLGVEGYMAQLKQVVYSTTEFPTVNAVQILIEGQEREFLGGDGVYIGRPLRRDSFG